MKKELRNVRIYQDCRRVSNISTLDENAFVEIYGEMPDGLPTFNAGYIRNNDFWEADKYSTVVREKWNILSIADVEQDAEDYYHFELSFIRKNGHNFVDNIAELRADYTGEVIIAGFVSGTLKGIKNHDAERAYYHAFRFKAFKGDLIQDTQGNLYKIYGRRAIRF